MTILLGLMLVFLVCSGCGGHTIQQPIISDYPADTTPEDSTTYEPGTLPTGPPNDAVQAGEQLDSAGHVIATLQPEFAPLTSYQNGMLCYTSSTDSIEPVESAARLSCEAGSGGVAWAIYRLTQAGEQPGLIYADINQCFPVGQPVGDYWVGVADYASHSWDWSGPFTEPHLRLPMEQRVSAGADYTSNLGNSFVCIAVMANSTIDIVGTGATTLNTTPPPAAPTGLLAGPITGGIELQWEAVSDQDIAGYGVYYSSTEFTSIDDPGVDRIDYLAPGPGCTLDVDGTLYAAVTAVNTAGVESSPCSPVQGTALNGIHQPVLVTVSSPACKIGDELELTAIGGETYSWDLDGDGTFDIEDSTEATVTIPVTGAGVLRPRVRGNYAGGTGVGYSGAGSLASQLEWTMYGFDAQHSHRTPAHGPDSPDLLWRFRTTGPGSALSGFCQAADGTLYVTGSGQNLVKLTADGTEVWRVDHQMYPIAPPIVGGDNTVFLWDSWQLSAHCPDGSSQWQHTFTRQLNENGSVGPAGCIYLTDRSGWLNVINADGTLKFEAYDAGLFIGTPAVADNGTIYVSTYDQGYVALDAAGNELWRFPTDGEMVTSQAFGPDGTIYLLTQSNRTVYALNPDGSERWHTQVSYVSGDLVLGPDNTLYAVKTDGDLLAINLDGTVKWTAMSNGDVNCQPVIDGNGRIIIRENLYGTILAYNPNGTLAWTSEMTNPHKFTQLAAGGSRIYAISTGNVSELDYGLHALNLDGSNAWTWTAGGEIESSPAIGVDGTVYFTCFDGNLYAVNPDGSLQWQYATAARIESSPAIDPAGVIYFVSLDGYLHAVSPDGTQRWQSACFGSSSPTIGEDGCIYVGDERTGVKAVNWDGSLRWEYQATDYAYFDTIPTISPDGSMIYFSENGDDDYLIAFNSDGTLAWRNLIVSSASISTPVISRFGLIYLGGYDAVRAFDSTGIEDWASSVDSAAANCTATDLIGTLYLGNDDGNLSAYDYNGDIKWSYACSGPINSAATIDGDGTIYVASSDRLYALNPDGTELWSTDLTGSAGSAPVISASGRIYIGSSDKQLYCFGAE